MRTGEVLADGFDRVARNVERVLEPGISLEGLVWRPDAEANSISWLVWHLTRVQDDHMSEIMNVEQTWIDGEYADRFADAGVDPAPDNTGYGHTSDQVGSVHAAADLLGEYHREVYQRSIAYAAGVSSEELDRIIDTSWDPPVTVGVRIVSVLNDSMQHIGQAAYVRGMWERRESG